MTNERKIAYNTLAKEAIKIKIPVMFYDNGIGQCAVAINKISAKVPKTRQKSGHSMTGVST